MTEPDTTTRPRRRDLNPRDVIVWTGQPRPNDFAKVIDRRKDDDTGWWMTDGSGLADYVWDGGGAWQTVRALCDGYDEAQRLREQVAEWQRLEEVARRRQEQAVTERITARQALADLIGELRGLAGHGRISGALLNDVVDPYDPDLFHCVHCEQYRDVEERHGGRDTDPGYYCDACVAGP